MNPKTLREIAAELGEIAEQKRAAYGDSITSSAAALTLLYPRGIPPEALDDVLLLTRIWDKMQRIATASGRGDDGESPYLDIAGYGLCGVAQPKPTKSLKGILHGWRDNASGPDASPSSPEPPASARPLTSAPTTPNANAPAAPETSPPPSCSSPAPENAPAATAAENASRVVVVPEKVRKLFLEAEERNRHGCCAQCGGFYRAVSWVVGFSAPDSKLTLCTAYCADLFSKRKLKLQAESR